MSHPELLILGVLRALVEVAMGFWAGQGLLYILAGRGRVNNPMYQPGDQADAADFPTTDSGQASAICRLLCFVLGVDWFGLLETRILRG